LSWHPKEGRLVSRGFSEHGRSDPNAKTLSAIRRVKTEANELIPPGGVSGKIKAPREGYRKSEGHASRGKGEAAASPLLQPAEKGCSKPSDIVESLFCLLHYLRDRRQGRLEWVNC
jgi:hypothetical protein